MYKFDLWFKSNEVSMLLFYQKNSPSLLQTLFALFLLSSNAYFVKGYFLCTAKTSTEFGSIS
jgi:hypothetical protein